jgi:hypothetical protein
VDLRSPESPVCHLDHRDKSNGINELRRRHFTIVQSDSFNTEVNETFIGGDKQGGKRHRDAAKPL